MTRCVRVRRLGVARDNGAFRESSDGPCDDRRKMKRVLLMMAAAASLATALPLATPAFARDGDQDRRAERHESRGGGQQRGERGGHERRGPPGRERGQGQGQGQDRSQGQYRGQGRGQEQDRGGPRWQAQAPRRDDGDRRRYDAPPRYEDRRRYDDGPRPNYMDGPRPNYMSPAPGVSARRGNAPDNYRGGGGVVDDYRRYRLRPPPQGYDWVRMGNGFALVERGSGRVFDRVN